MTDTTATMDLEEQIARIDRMREEGRKFAVEQHKLAAEQSKLAAEALKLTRDHALSGWQLMITGMASGAALVGASLALFKYLIP